jgi:flagellar protein FlaG
MEISTMYALGTSAPASSVPEPGPGGRGENRRLAQAVRELNEAEAAGDNSELTFSLDRQTGRALVRIIDKRTNEVIQQIPPEYVLRMHEQLRQRQKGE